MQLNELSTNTYFITNETTGETIVVDPALDSEEITEYLNSNGLKPVAVLLTHGHFDHIYGVELVRNMGAKVICAEKERELLGDCVMNLSKRFGPVVTAVPDETVKDGDELSLAGFSIRVIETPGHTAGCVCYDFPEENVIFTGDTLFKNTIGRTDVPTGDWETEVDSVKKKLFVLPEDRICYPGHGGPTTIGYEKKYNRAIY